MEHIVATTVKLHTSEAARFVQTIQDASQFATRPPEGQAIGEGIELFNATMHRAAQLQKSWMQDWMNWAQYAQTLQGADTVPKYVERTGNIVLQAQAQLASQANEFSELWDNIAVNMGFWVKQQIDKAETEKD